MAIERIGLFHFGINHNDRIGSLKAKLEASGNVRDSLIVPPEGFNLGRFYKGIGERSHEPQIPSDLGSLAKKSGAVSVAGLILEDGHDPPYSGAYLIDGKDERLICYKMVDGRTGNYTPCPQDAADIRNPICYGSICLGVLICADAQEFDGSAEGTKGGDHSLRNLRVEEKGKNLSKGNKMPGFRDFLR